MHVILPKGILEAVRVSEYRLGPLTIPFSPEDPPFHVLGLYDEDSKARDDYMVDLRRSARTFQSEIMKRPIGL